MVSKGPSDQPTAEGRFFVLGHWSELGRSPALSTVGQEWSRVASRSWEQTHPDDPASLLQSSQLGPGPCVRGSVRMGDPGPLS